MHQIIRVQTNKDNNLTLSSSPRKSFIKALLQGHLVTSMYVLKKKPSYFQWYNLNAYYDYHARIVGYNISNCTSFKQGYKASLILVFAI